MLPGFWAVQSEQKCGPSPRPGHAGGGPEPQAEMLKPPDERTFLVPESPSGSKTFVNRAYFLWAKFTWAGNELLSWLLHRLFGGRLSGLPAES